MREATLYCFYDLAESPASYDFFTYMQLAELHRRRYDFSNLFFVFVPGPKGGFRDDNLSKTILQRCTMMRNVIMPSCQLLSSCKGVVWLQKRDKVNAFFKKADGQVFPRNYTPQEPMADYTWYGLVAAYLRGEAFTMLREPLGYTKMVDSLFPDTVRKLITVTIRETPYYTDRNTDFQAWLSFFKTLDSSQYEIVIIPDTNNLSNNIFKGFEYCKIASIDVLFRTAIYRKAYLNMFHGSGTSVVASFSNSPLLITQPLDTDIASSVEWFRHVVAVDPYEHHQYAMWKKNQRFIWQLDKIETAEDTFEKSQPDAPKKDRYVWEGNTAEIIEDAFKKYVEEFPEKPELPIEEHGFQSNAQKELACRIGFLYTIDKSQIKLKQEDVDTLVAIVDLMPDFVEPRYMLAMIASQVGAFNKAIRLFDDCINLLGSACQLRISDESHDDWRKKICQLKAEALEKSNQFDETLKEYIGANRSRRLK